MTRRAAPGSRRSTTTFRFSLSVAIEKFSLGSKSYLLLVASRVLTQI
jgi:hypothetical protein